MIRQRSPIYTRPTARVREAPECDCGSLAKLTINGNERCYECAEDEGVKVHSDYRRYGR